MKKNTRKLCSVICIVLMLALILCHLMPFWTLDGESTSLQEFIWFCTDHNDISNYLEDVDPQFDMNSFILLPILMFVAAVLGVAFCLLKSDRPWTVIFPAVCGLSGIIAYLTDPALRSGFLWWLHLLVCVGVLATAVVSSVFVFKTKGKEE